jgi:hypothetical protein
MLASYRPQLDDETKKKRGLKMVKTLLDMYGIDASVTLGYGAFRFHTYPLPDGAAQYHYANDSFAYYVTARSEENPHALEPLENTKGSRFAGDLLPQIVEHHTSGMDFETTMPRWREAIRDARNIEDVLLLEDVWGRRRKGGGKIQG